MVSQIKLRTFAIGLGVLSLGSCGLSTIPHYDRANYQVKVTGSERNVSGTRNGTTSKYIVFTEDAKTSEERVFQNTDSTIECVFDGCKWDSSNLQGKLKKAEKENQVCDVKTYGWRVPFFSWYENVVDVSCK